MWLNVLTSIRGVHLEWVLEGLNLELQHACEALHDCADTRWACLVLRDISMNLSHSANLLNTG